MFQSISDILSKFTQRQRIVALLLLLFSVILISVGPQLIDSWKGGVPDEYKEVIQTQNQQIRDLQIELGGLNTQLVSSFQQCTDRVIQREREIAEMIDTIIKSNSNRYISMMMVEDTSSILPSAPPSPIYINDDYLLESLDRLRLELMYGNQ